MNNKKEETLNENINEQETEIVKEEDNSNKEIETLQIRIKELEDKVLRTQAELQNYRRRKDEEVDMMIKYSNENLIKEILPILDSFDRAMAINNNDSESLKFIEGFKMINNNLINILNKFGVKEIDAFDKPFDHNLHQALLTDSIDDKEDGIVLEVLQKGYTLKDKIIRPAMVKVNSKERKDDKHE